MDGAFEMHGLRPFAVELMDEILSKMFVVKRDLSLYYAVCGMTPPSGISVRLKQAVKEVMRWFRFARVDWENRELRDLLGTVDPHWDGLQFLYERLENRASRDTLIKVIAHRMLGALRVTLPAETPRYRELFEQARSLENREDTLTAGVHDWTLSRMKLETLGYPITMYANPQVVLAIFGMRQYEYRDAAGQVLAGARPGDLVLDAGACWGDTALFFAERVGPQGQVISFEFVPRNLEIFAENRKLNPMLAEQIRVVEAPLLDEDGKLLSFALNGSATRMTSGAEPAASSFRTTTIDHVVRERQLGRVGMIKMDIEGAEPAALRGAEATLRRDRPQLAIALYHSLNDFVEIPRWIADLNLGYRFYLGHETIFDAETILFAVPTE